MNEYGAWEEFRRGLVTLNLVTNRLEAAADTVEPMSPMGLNMAAEMRADTMRLLGVMIRVSGIRFSAPLPVSTNDVWQPGGRGFKKNPTATDYGWLIKAALNEQNVSHEFPARLPLGVSVGFIASDKRQDLDNYVGKNLLDSMQGILYPNDNQIVELHAYKRFDPANPALDISIYPVEE